jgi:hypothetical protein
MTREQMLKTTLVEEKRQESRLRAILDYHDLSEDTSFELIGMDRGIISVIIHAQDSAFSESFEKPVAIILNKNLFAVEGNEAIAEALHINLSMFGMGLVEATLIFTILMMEYGHIPQDRNSILTIETITSWQGQHVDTYTQQSFDDAMASLHNRLLQEDADNSIGDSQS